MKARVKEKEEMSNRHYRKKKLLGEGWEGFLNLFFPYHITRLLHLTSTLENSETWWI
jgi:hypothetical protein